jgi:outer membrane protein
LGFLALTVVAVACAAAAPKDGSAGALKIGTVNFKTCIEQSKIGKSEQVKFEKVKKELELDIEQKEKALNELSPKFSEEYLDSLTPEAEKDLKEKFQALSQELTEKHNQYYQVLNQKNMQVMQNLFERISTASSSLAKEKQLDLVLNDEACFFKDKALDVSSEIIAIIDAKFEEELKNEKK